MHFRNHHGLRRGISLLLAAVFVSGCVTWQQAVVPASEVIPQGARHVRIRTTAGDEWELYQPQVQGGQLAGYIREGDDAPRAAFPVSQVARVEVRRFNGTRTLMLVSSIAVPIGILAIFAVANGSIGGGM